MSSPTIEKSRSVNLEFNAETLERFEMAWRPRSRRGHLPVASELTLECLVETMDCHIDTTEIDTVDSCNCQATIDRCA
jgi:hypothetical protein